MEKIEKQMEFLFEIDKCKDIFRQSLVLGKRRENDAEHSWHMCIVAMTLKEYFTLSFSMEKALKLILIHDLVEIYAGDTPAFGPEREDKYEAEYEAAKKLFSLLPKNQEKEFLELWLEFEKAETNEAIYANLCDKYQGFMQNLTSDGHTWKKFNVSMEKVLKRAEIIKLYAPELFDKYIYPQFINYQKKGIIK